MCSFWMEQERNTSRISLSTFLFLFSSWQGDPMIVLLSFHHHLDSSWATVHLCSFHHPASFVFSFKIQWLIFPHTPSKIIQAKVCLGSIYYISQLHCCRWTQLICVWPCSGYGLWPCIIHHVFLLLNMIFPG